MKYIAFIRGIGPENPNMHAEKLKEFFEKLGYKNVTTVLSSGNILFEADIKDRKALENTIEEQLPKTLGFNKSVLIRTQNEIKKMFASNPFKGVDDIPTSRLNVTFLKNGKEVFSIIDTVNLGTVKIMAKLEKEHGKEITMRTWKTVEKIIKRMD